MGREQKSQSSALGRLPVRQQAQEGGVEGGGGALWRLFSGTLTLAGPGLLGEGGVWRRGGVVVKGAVVSGFAVTSHSGKAGPLVTACQDRASLTF